jgi:hypothetical protein
MIEDIGTDIASGAIAVEVLRPVSVVLFRIVVELGEAFVRLGLAALVGGVLVIAFAGGPPSAAALALAIPASILAAVLILASYPLDLFVGATKLLLSTAVPAAFVTGLPTALVDEFNVATALALVGAAGGFMALGAISFKLGLRKYASGAVWTRA